MSGQGPAQATGLLRLCKALTRRSYPMIARGVRRVLGASGGKACQQSILEVAHARQGVC